MTGIDFLRANQAVLAAVLVFFTAILVLNRLFGRTLPLSRVLGTIKLAMLGLLLMVLENRIGGVPVYGGLVRSVQGLVVLLCLANFAAYAVVDLYLHYRMDREVPTFVHELLALLIYAAFAMISLRVIFDIDVASILTTTTILTAAVAFAMQTTLANIISGFTVQSDPNLKRRTWISIPDKGIAGEIMNVGFRYTTLLTSDSQKAMVPNHFLMQNLVLGLGGKDEKEKAAVNLKVNLGYELPPEQAMGLLLRVLREEKRILGEPAPSARISGLGESSVEYNLRYTLEDHSDHPAVKGDVLSRIWYAVTREGHRFPYPHLELIGASYRDPFSGDQASVRGLLDDAEILEPLGEEERERLSERIEVRIYGAGETVVREGDEGDSLFLVKRGRMTVSIDGATVGMLQAGDVFGERSLLTGEPRKATVVAATQAHLFEIQKSDLEPLIQANPGLLDGLSAVLAKREEINDEHRTKAVPEDGNAGLRETFLSRVKAFFDM